MSKEYKSVKKTKKAFEMALAELAKDHQLNKITVKEICEIAQLSRNAFYFHYKDINDLITDIERGVIEEATRIITGLEEIGFPKSVYATIDKFVDLFEEKRDTVLMLMDKSFSTTFTETISKMYSDFNYKFYVRYHGDKPRISYDFFYIYLSNGFYGTLKYWLQNPEKMSKEALKGLTYLLTKRLLMPVDPDIEALTAEKK